MPAGNSFIDESLAIIAQNSGKKMEPFSSIVKYDGESMKLEFDELYYADWEWSEEDWKGEEK